MDFSKIPEGLKLGLSGINYVDFTGKLSDCDPWQYLEQSLAFICSADGPYNIAVQEKKAYAALHDFLHPKKSRPLFLWAAAVVLIMAGVTFYIFSLPKGNLAAPDMLSTPSISSEVNQVLKIAYTSPLGNTPIQAAAMVLTSKKNELKEKWVPLNNGQELSSEDRYFIALNPIQDCYVYVFQIDSTGTGLAIPHQSFWRSLLWPESGSRRHLD
jgi:hypothetical protein